MEFEAILNEIYTFRALFDEKVEDEFGASILANEIEDMIAIGTRLHETEASINAKLMNVDMELENIRRMVPIC